MSATRRQIHFYSVVAVLSILIIIDILSRYVNESCRLRINTRKDTEKSKPVTNKKPFVFETRNGSTANDAPKGKQQEQNELDSFIAVPLKNSINLCSTTYLDIFSGFTLSYSLFGKDSWELFGQNVENIAKEASDSTFYGNWSVRIYHENFPSKLQIDLRKKYENLYFCNVRELKLPFFNETNLVNINGRMWRFIPISDPTVDIVCSRDLDSPLYKREEDAVNYWLHSGKIFHTMRDHYWHNIPLLAGMWCYKISENRVQASKILKSLLENAGRRTCDGEACDKQDDQTVLNKFMWPVVKTDSIQHDSYMCKSIGGSIPFSTKRESPSKFVGCKRPCTENLSQKCPVDCRPKGHKDWEFC